MKKSQLDNGYAIVIGSPHFNALGIIRSLGEAGVPSVFICSGAWGNASCSRYTLQSYSVCDKKELLFAIQDVIRIYGGRPSVFPCSEVQMLWLDELKHDLKDVTYLPSFSDEAKEIMRKDVMGRLAKDAGFLLPDEMLLHMQTSHVREKIAAFGLPCILKPVSGLSGCKGDICVCKCVDDIDTAINTFKRYEEVLLQRFVDGTTNFTVEYCGCKSKTQPVQVYAEMQKIREFPPERGSTSFAIIRKDIQYLDIAVLDRFLEETGFVGIFDLEIKVADNKPYFLEINFRNGAPSYGFTKAGFNIPAVWHFTQIGQPVSTPDVHDVLVQCEGIDLSHVFQHNITIFQYLHDFFHADAHMIVNRKDPRPALSSWRLLKPFIQSKFYKG